MFYIYIYIYIHPHTLLVCVVSYCICDVVYHDAYQCDRCRKPFPKVSCHSCSVALAAYLATPNHQHQKAFPHLMLSVWDSGPDTSFMTPSEPLLTQPSNAFARSAELPCLKPWLGSPKLLSTKPESQQPSGDDTLQLES